MSFNKRNVESQHRLIHQGKFFMLKHILEQRNLLLFLGAFALICLLFVEWRRTSLLEHYHSQAARYMQLHRYSDAARQYQAALHYENDPDTYLQLATAYQFAGDPVNAVKAYQAALHLDSDLKLAREGLEHTLRILQQENSGGSVKR